MTLTLTLSPNLHQATGPSLTLTRTDFKIKCPITGQSFRMNELKCVLYLTCCEPLYSVACGWNGLSKFKLTLISIYKVSTGTSRMRIVKVKYRQSATLYGVPFFFFFFSKLDIKRMIGTESDISDTDCLVTSHGQSCWKPVSGWPIWALEYDRETIGITWPSIIYSALSAHRIG